MGRTAPSSGTAPRAETAAQSRKTKTGHVRAGKSAESPKNRASRAHSAAAEPPLRLRDVLALGGTQVRAGRRRERK